MSSPNKPRGPDPTPDINITNPALQVYPGVSPPSPTHSHAHQDANEDASHETHDRPLMTSMARFRTSPYDFLREISLYVSGSDWRSYDSIVGQPIFYPGFTENMKGMVLATPMLRAKIAELAEGRVGVEDGEGLFGREGEAGYAKRRARRREAVEGSIREVAEKMTDEMVCKMESKPFIRGAYYLCTQILTRAYHQGIHVSGEEVLRLRAVAEKAAKQGQSIVFLPNHRSHVDYVSLQLICYRLGLALPTVVAGDNLNFPLVGPFLQHAGAMWIRRSFGDDQLYVTLLQAYIDTLLQKGFNFECFIEGGRSRIGKLLPPKFGILSFLMDSLLSGRVEDTIICPVSTQYDKVIEVDSYISELLGVPKRKENLTDFLSASSVLSLKLGRVDVRFHEPWSLRGFINEQQRRMDSLTLSQQNDLNRAYNSDLRVRLLRTLGYRVLSDINDVAVIMPTALIGTILLTLRGRGVGKTELIRRVEWLSDRVRARGGRVAHFGGPTASIVERGLDVLGPKLVGMQRDVAEETYYAVDRFQLSFYRNMTIHLFISEALVSASIYTRIKAGGPVETQSISHAALLEQVSFLSQLFRGEFIFHSEGLEANLRDTLQGLEKEGVVDVHRPANADASKASEGQAIESVELSRSEREIGRENFDFYCFLIWPFIEVAWLGAVSLLMLTPPMDNLEAQKGEPVWLDNKAVQANAQLLGKTLYAQGDLSYLEAVNKETLRNAHNRFQEEGIIEVKKPPKGNRTGASEMVRLADDWIPQRNLDGKLKPEGKLWEFCEEISKSRLEGKNRRDGDAVVGRVMRLVETVSEKLWRGNVVSTGSEAGSSSPAGLAANAEQTRPSKEKRRRVPLRSKANL